MNNKFSNTLYTLLESTVSKSKLGQVLNNLLVVLICLNLAAIVLASFSYFSNAYSDWLYGFEVFSVAVFSVEYLARIISARQYYPSSRHPYLKKIFSFMSIIDLLSIMPFYFPFIFPIDLRFLRTLRLLRLVRIFKLTRYVESLNLIGRVLKREKEILLTTVSLIAILLFVASCLMYNIESEAQPQKFSNIGSSLWWAVVTLTTVGYGDVYPITLWGKILGGFIAILGIGFVALPTGILSSGFINEVNREKGHHHCPHCGGDLTKP